MFWVNGVYVDSDGAAVEPQPELPVPGITDGEVLAQQASDQLTAALAKIAALETQNTYLASRTVLLEWDGFDLLADYTIPGLNKIAAALGIDPTGKTKPDLVAAISLHPNHEQAQPSSEPVTPAEFAPTEGK